MSFCLPTGMSPSCSKRECNQIYVRMQGLMWIESTKHRVVGPGVSRGKGYSKWGSILHGRHFVCQAAELCEIEPLEIRARVNEQFYNLSRILIALAVILPRCHNHAVVGVVHIYGNNMKWYRNRPLPISVPRKKKRNTEKKNENTPRTA